MFSIANIHLAGLTSACEAITTSAWQAGFTSQLRQADSTCQLCRV